MNIKRRKSILKRRAAKAFRPDGKQTAGPPQLFIGELRMMKDPFELNDLNVSGFIGDVKIDLSKAMIPEGESTMTISGVIGNVDVYVRRISKCPSVHRLLSAI